MRPTIRLNPRLALALALIGTALVAFGSVRAVPFTAPGQIVLSVFLGAVLLFVGAVELAVALAVRPDLMSAPEPAPAAKRGWLSRALGGFGLPALPVGVLVQRRWLRWGLVALFVAVAAAALLLVASDVWAYKSLRWAIPRGRARFVY